jgi:ligand-binding sensor domain-containing protein
MGQAHMINVRHITTREGLADGVVRAIGQDRFGYIWIGTVSGLNRFDGTNLVRYQSDPRQPGSPPPSVPRNIYSDSKGNLWIGFNNGLYRFEHETDRFILVNGSESYSITKIVEDTAAAVLHLLSDNGIAQYHMNQKEFMWIDKNGDLNLREGVENKYMDIAFKNSRLYIATNKNLRQLARGSKDIHRLDTALIPEKDLQHLAVDHEGNIWLSFGGNSHLVRKIHPSLKSSELMPLLDEVDARSHNNFVRNISVDKKGRIWFLNSNRGVANYNNQTKAFTWYKYQEVKANTLSPTHAYDLFESREGAIWLGTEGYGVDYFDPDKSMFKVISSYEDPVVPRNATWARAAVEDIGGDIWMSWVGGLTRFDIKQKKYTHWENFYSDQMVLYSMSVRALLADSKGFIWIGTAKGLNRLEKATGKIEFLTIRDSMPESGFYWSIVEDSQKNIWAGTGEKLFYKNAQDGKHYSSASHPLLATVIDTGVRAIYEDNRKRLWFGLNGTGLVMYDPAKNLVKKWSRTQQNDSTLLGNTITAIHQDKSGVIWLSSFNGLVGYDVEKDVFHQYTHAQQLPSLKCSGLMVDSLNRLWVGTTSGLAMLDTARKHFTTFTVEDGLPTLEFSDMPATKMRNGDFLFPTMLGYVQFNPLNHSSRYNPLPLYISSIRVFDKVYKGNTNTESIRKLDLRHNQNFFSFQLVAINYTNPVRTWYAYMLEGFDKDWIISKNGLVNYTNVPGGKYKFRYKTSLDPEQWNVPEKQLDVFIGTVFYKTWWFILLISVAVVSLLYLWYLARINQQKKIYSLQSKAQLLEKEKALVKFEGLKQQLNPHFLFNSLSSLGSLIRMNQALAISFLEKLSKTYRYILQSRDLDLISLEEEIRFAASYFSLLETRFNEGLQINIDISQEAMKYKVVPVILQNMIDNAIKHNIIAGDTPLTLDIFTDDGYLVVRNNLQLKKLVETSNKQGLNNLLSLYRYLTEKPMTIERTSQHFTVKIPLI